MIRLRLAAVLLVAPLAAGCGVSEVDATAVEGSIRDGVREGRGVDVDVQCPDGIPWEAGTSFQCTLSRGQGATSTATVKLSKSRFDWKLD